MNSYDQFKPGPKPRPGMGDDVACWRCGAKELDTGLECDRCGADNWAAVTGEPPRVPRRALSGAKTTQPEQDERAAFEAWAVKTHGTHTLSDLDAGSMWSAWQARAALKGTAL